MHIFQKINTDGQFDAETELSKFGISEELHSLGINLISGEQYGIASFIINEAKNGEPCARKAICLGDYKGQSLEGALDIIDRPDGKSRFLNDDDRIVMFNSHIFDISMSLEKGNVKDMTFFMHKFNALNKCGIQFLELFSYDEIINNKYEDVGVLLCTYKPYATLRREIQFDRNAKITDISNLHDKTPLSEEELKQKLSLELQDFKKSGIEHNPYINSNQSSLTLGRVLQRIAYDWYSGDYKKAEGYYFSI